MTMDLTKEEIERYAPYHTMPEFKHGYDDYNECAPFADYENVAGQAYDRGAECAMRRGRVNAAGLVLCQTADGWSLHAPGSTDLEIAEGNAPYLRNGPGKPTAQDYAQAYAELLRRNQLATS